MARRTPADSDFTGDGTIARRLTRRRMLMWAWTFVAAALLALSALWLDRGMNRFVADVNRGTEIQQNLELIQSVLAGIKNAESAQRGLLLTSDARFDLEYFKNAPDVALRLTRLADRMAGDPAQAEVRARGRAERNARAAQEGMAASLAELTALTTETRQLSDYASLLQSCRSMDEALRVTAQVFRRMLPDQGGSVYLLRASADQLQRIGHWGERSDGAPENMPASDCWALRRGQSHAVDDLREGAACPHSPPPREQQAASLCVPVIAQGETLGLLSLASAEALQPSRRTLVEALAEQLSLALANIRLQESLRSQSIRDPLTALFNRRYLEESPPRELARCERRNQPLVLLMLDIDHFKRFNDSHGHDAGDAVLVQFARVLESGARAGDIPCRLGGEEFTLVLPETTLEQGLQRADEIRQRIEAMRVTYQRTTMEPVTVSIGLAMYPTHARAGPELLRAADAALYRAKREGRNRVIAA